MTAEKLSGAIDSDRATLRVAGADAETFLQGLLTNDVSRAGPASAVYAALLTPQGKFLFDAFVLRPEPKQFLLETASASLDAFAKRLAMYKLRADVEIARASVYKTLLVWPTTEGDEGRKAAADAASAAAKLGRAFYDPRHADLGLRILVESSRADEAASLAPLGAAPSDIAMYHRRRVQLGVPIAGDDLVRDDSFPLEFGFDQIQGVDFRKGCYVGQEVTARMKHKATLKKALYFVDVGAAPNAAPGDELSLDDRPAGTLGSVEAGIGLALLRVDRADGELTLEGGEIATVSGPVFE